MKKVAANLISKIIFIRRDNVGDLVCTTPAIRAVRKKLPDAKIGVLVNTYNADAVKNNPDIDEVYIYQKTGHVPEKNKISVWLHNFQIFRKIRKEHYDVAVGCGLYSPTTERFAFFTGAKYSFGYMKSGMKSFFYTNALIQPDDGMHEVQRTFDLIKFLVAYDQPGDLVLIPDPPSPQMSGLIKRDKGRPLIAVAISARLTKNRWPINKFIRLIEKILAVQNADVMFLWAPTLGNNPGFSGDDGAAARINDHFKNSIMPCPTLTISSLVTAISLSDIVITLDTGSLHIAAALKKSIVALMIEKKVRTWHPWNTKYIAVTDENDVQNISVDNVFNATDILVHDFQPHKNIL